MQSCQKHNRHLGVLALYNHLLYITLLVHSLDQEE
jgi:hypothetical protein